MSIVTGVQTGPPPTSRDRAPPRLEIGRDRPERRRPGGLQVRSCTPSRSRGFRAPSPRRRRRACCSRRSARSSPSSRSSTVAFGTSWLSATSPRTSPSFGSIDDELHVELEDEELAAAVREAAVRDDAEVLEDGAVRRLSLPEDLPGRAVDREDVGVVRRHVERAADRERIRLLAAARVRVEPQEVHRVHAAELVDVRRRDLGQRREAVRCRASDRTRASRRRRRRWPRDGRARRLRTRREHDRRGDRHEPVPEPEPRDASSHLGRRPTRRGTCRRNRLRGALAVRASATPTARSAGGPASVRRERVIGHVAGDVLQRAALGGVPEARRPRRRASDAGERRLLPPTRRTARPSRPPPRRGDTAAPTRPSRDTAGRRSMPTRTTTSRQPRARREPPPLTAGSTDAPPPVDPPRARRREASGRRSRSCRCRRCSSAPRRP